MKTIKEAKSILCLNGDIANLKNDPIFTHKKIIVATDGAVDKLLGIGIKPAIAIGDMDSISTKDHKGIELIRIPDQSRSDFEKAIKYLTGEKLMPTIVLGITGGFLDHILHNLSIFSDADCILYTGSQIGYILKVSETFELKPNTKISLIGMPKAKIKTTGLKWDLDSVNIEFPGNNSCFNRTSDKSISIEIIEGKLLLLIYSEHIEDMGML